ncbi:MAG TPA: sigma-54 dependent transcriptional regulator [Myxococcales bacterium]|nr:sigma-54 dependent transcriptional regulator [Myxococcales bacterium]
MSIELARAVQLVPEAAASVPGMITCDPALSRALDLLRRAAPARLPVLIRGESGSGKEVAARAVHELSPRSSAPFVPVNCGAIAPELAEAELFGHERGAFTGAIASSVGAFGIANGGTLFLDEIGDLPLPLQVKLLRALEAGEVKPVGSPRARTIDVRIVCATHRDLRKLVRTGTFREDLYYRLAGVAVELPPLRERKGDIVPLAEHFLAQERDGVERKFSVDGEARLLAHHWPGNARELRHVVQLAVVLSDSPTIRASALQIDDGIPRWSDSREGGSAAEMVDLRGKTLDHLEAVAIRAAWQRHAGRRGAIARELGIARSSLLRKLDALGLRNGASPPV